MLASARIAFAQAGPELVTACLNALRTHPQPPRGRPAYATGRTAQQIREEHDDASLAVYGPAHLATLITGRGPTQGAGSGGGSPLWEILAQWAQNKPGFQLRPGSTYEAFGRAAAYNMHKFGNELYRTGQPSGLLDQVLSPAYIETLKARIAAGEMSAITSALRGVLQTA